MDTLLRRQYTPGDPLFHHFISTSEFTHRFSPSLQTYNAVTTFARANGLSVTRTHSDRLLLEVAGPASAVESAFQVHLQRFMAADGRVFHAPDADPAIPAALDGKLSGIIGLQNAALRHPQMHHLLPTFLPAEIGSDPNTGALTPSDIKTAYNLSSTTLTGAGRTLALFELDGYTASDISAYEAAYNLPVVPLVNILSGGASGLPSDSDGPIEVTLDIELMAALAPGATAIRVYEAPNTEAGVLAAYGQIADDNSAKEVSSSWGLAEDESSPSNINAENIIFQQMAAQGQSMFAAAGDSGAYDDGSNLTVDDPASQPYVTGVGGTTLSTITRGGAYRAESTWGDPNEISDSPFGSGGGGGISAVWPLPDYQMGIAGINQSSLRNVPDVSLDADPATGYAIYSNGGWGIEGGTSCAAPLWAAFTALVNQERQTNGEADLGFANPAIYAIGSGASYTSGFHDISDNSTNLFYHAVPGYDDATGWGSFDGANLLTLLAPSVVVTSNPLTSVTLTPTSVVGGLTATGTVTLANPAPMAGATVGLTSGNTLVTVPSAILVSAGATTATFDVTTSATSVAVPVSITATYSGGSRSATLTVLPAPVVITPASLVLSPTSVGGGASSTATLTLTGPAPTGGLTVSLASSDPAATVPATVTIPAGSVSAQFSITTVSVSTQTVAVISATVNSVTKTAKLTLQAPTLEPITLSPVTVFGGQSAAGVLTLTYPATAGGAAIALSSSDPSAAVPATVTIPVGKTSASFMVTTSAVTVPTTVTLSAKYGTDTQTVVLTVNPVLPGSVTLVPAAVIGSVSSVGIASLNAPAPAGGLTATLTSSSPDAQTPATLNFPAGTTSASFTVTTSVVSAPVTATISVSVNQSVQTATLTIQPIQISELSLSSGTVLTGKPVTGSLALNAPAPAGGLTVAVSSSSASATVPSSVSVPAGSSAATFPIATPHPGTVTISALLSGTTQTASLVITAAPGTTFPAGLNMISAPYDYTGVALDSLFGYTGVKLATWETQTDAYVLTAAAPADTLHLGRGYWVNLPTATTLSTVGAPASTTQDFSIALLPGWNQIGYPFTTPTMLNNVSVSAGGTAAAFDTASTSSPLIISSLVYRYSPAQGATPGSYIWVRDTDSLQPGLGYWVYAYQAATFTIPHP